MNGRKVKSEINNNQTSTAIEVSDLSAGEYVLKISNEDKITSQKIIIK
ncbi:T9SS type A sorting domain-containing protein [Aequorivita sp. F64183]|uniref:T9SS type A sorting domain-containing protein n=1 Tax=Aequorivita xiaoshiensis TaxID=2874476 RepID=A0A9X1R2N7_9FLAO|nr:T9SS type A sorting domain-containing protein [Aequorivita xiaoshiensis]